MLDFAVQRLNMVESQVRPSDVTDRRVVRAMSDIPRERFVPQPAHSVAYLDGAITVQAATATAPARQLLAPRVLAKMIQHLDIGAAAVVLVIGCATGYSAAVLSHIAQTVVALEHDPALAAEATRTLDALGIDNVALVTGPLPAGHAAEGPYDAILFDGAVDAVPAEVLDQLKDGGKLMAIVESGGVGRATQWRRLGGRFGQRVVFDAAGAVLPGFVRRPGFVF